MPNWCYNHLIVHGAQRTVARFLKLVRNAEHRIDFEKILPQPKEYPDDKEGSNGMPLGWTWRVNVWGTKWNTQGDKDEVPTWLVTSTGASLHFDTAWAPPTGIIKRLGELFPTLYFALDYFESNLCFGGRCTANPENGFNNQYTENAKDVLYKRLQKKFK